MRPSSHAVAAASSLAGAFVGAAVALQLGVVELPGVDGPPAALSAPRPPSPAPSAALSRAPAADASGAADRASDDGSRAGPDRVGAGELRERRATVAALRLLHRWDARRERAWERGDPASLARLYTVRSVAGRRDVALLERYVARGWSVDGTTPRIVDAAVALRRADRVRLRVAETYPGGRSEPQARVVTLVRSATGWRVEQVSLG